MNLQEKIAELELKKKTEIEEKYNKEINELKKKLQEELKKQEEVKKKEQLTKFEQFQEEVNQLDWTKDCEAHISMEPDDDGCVAEWYVTITGKIPIFNKSSNQRQVITRKDRFEYRNKTPEPDDARLLIDIGNNKYCLSDYFTDRHGDFIGFGFHIGYSTNFDQAYEFLQAAYFRNIHVNNEDFLRKVFEINKED